jgi:hypothetical protein
MDVCSLLRGRGFCNELSHVKKRPTEWECVILWIRCNSKKTCKQNFLFMVCGSVHLQIFK